MSRFATGVTIVSSRLGEEVRAFTANAFTSVSLDPLLVLVCVDRRIRTHELIEKSRIFAVSFLADDQQEISTRLAGKVEEDKRLVAIEHERAETGAPILAHCLAWLDCRVERMVDGGTHSIVLGRAVAGSLADDGGPLIFFGSAYRRLSPS